MALIGASKLGQLLMMGCRDYGGGVGKRGVSQEWADKVLQCLAKIDFVAEPVKDTRNDAREDEMDGSESR